MKQNLTLSALALLMCFTSKAQLTPNIEMRETAFVQLGTITYPIKVVNVSKKKTATTGKSYSTMINGQPVVVTEQESKIDFDAGSIYLPSTDPDAPNTKNFLSDNKFLKCDIKFEDGILYLYPWPYSENKGLYQADKIAFNSLLEKRQFYIELPGRKNLSLKYSSFFLGAVTLPVKAYVTKANSAVLDNTVFDVNLNLAIGKRFGRRHFVSLPHEKEVRVYENLWSISGLIGISKINLTKNNIVGDDAAATFQDRSAASISLGVGVGYHFREFSLYLASGFDNPINAYADSHWAYTRQMWVGFGIGFQAKG